MWYLMLGVMLDMNAKRMTAVFAILLMVICVLAAAPLSGEDVENEEETEKQEFYLGGEITNDVTYTENQILIINKNLSIKNGGRIIVQGSFVVNEDVTVTIEGSGNGMNSQLQVYGDATINGTIITKSGIKEGDIGGDVGLFIHPQSYKNLVTINGTITALGDTSGTPVRSMDIESSAVNTDNPTQKSRIIVNGQLAVSTNTVAVVNNVIISNGAQFYNYGTISGSISLHGDAYFDGSVFVNGETTDFKIYMAAESANISLAEVSGSNPVRITDLGMLAYTYGGIDYYIEGYPDNISAMREKALAYDAANQKFSLAKKNVISFASVKNVRVTETIVTGIAYDSELSKNRMFADAIVSVGPLDDTKAVMSSGDTKGTIAVENGCATDFGSMILLDTCIMVSAGAEAEVIGNITANNAVSDPATIKVDGKLIIGGSIAMSPVGITVGTDGAIRSALYVTKSTDNVQTYHYTTLKDALAAESKSISILGTLIIDEDITVPKGTELITDSNSSKFDSIFGKKCSIIIEDTGSLTIISGALFTFGGDMAVQGTFVIENINYGITFGDYKVYSDVKIKEGVFLEYTNIMSALERSKSGDELSIFNPVSEHGAIIDRNVTIPYGVKFTVPEKTESKTYAITVINGYILRVDGTLEVLSGGVLKQLKDDAGQRGNGWSDTTSAPKEGELVDYSVLMIGDKGIIKSTDKIEYEVQSGGSVDIDKSYRVAGAYFQEDDGVYCITSLGFAFDGITKVKDVTVSIYGKNAISGLSVSGREDCRVAVVFKEGSDITMDGFRIAYAKVTAEPGVKILGEIGTANGTIEFGEAEVSGSEYEAAFEDTFAGDSMNLRVSGKYLSKDDAFVAGTVYVSGSTAEKSFVFSGIKEDGEDLPTFIVAAGSKLYVCGDAAMITENSEFIVKGIVTLYSGGHLTSYVLSVLGTVDVTLMDGKSSKLSASNLLVGGTMDTFEEFVPVTTNGSAVINGAGSFDDPDALYLFSGSAVLADNLNSWMDYDAYNTQFYIDKTLWMTVYVKETGTVEFASANGHDSEYVVKYHLIPTLYNRLFKAWQIQDSTGAYVDVKPVVSATVGERDYSRVFASLKDDFYSIMVVADAGISDVYIDGKLMTKSTSNNTFSSDVAAGEHTLSYNLSAGYTGEASIMAIDGKMITGAGLKFTVNDDVYDTDRDVMVIQLTGIKKAEEPEPASPINLVNFLLIVLIGIVAIIAIVMYSRMARRY